MLRFFSFVLCLSLERDRKSKNYKYDSLGNSIPYKIDICFSLQDQKLRKKIHF